MKIKISEDTYLTTESSQSCHGAPVLQVGDAVYGPADIIGNGTGADIVYSWGSTPDRTSGEVNAAKSFLQQWTDGPQIIEKGE